VRSTLLFVVAHDRHDRYEALRKAFAGEAAVEVVLDRRQGEGRSPTLEDRRVKRVQRELASQGWALVRRLPTAGFVDKPAADSVY
jgi:hypothetical protein